MKVFLFLRFFSPPHHVLEGAGSCSFHFMLRSKPKKFLRAFLRRTRNYQDSLNLSSAYRHRQPLPFSNLLPHRRMFPRVHPLVDDSWFIVVSWFFFFLAQTPLLVNAPETGTALPSLLSSAARGQPRGRPPLDDNTAEQIRQSFLWFFFPPPKRRGGGGVK